MSGTEKDKKNQKLEGFFKGLTHELRVRILRTLRETKAEQGKRFRGLSPSELKDSLGTALGNVDYHVGKLKAFELVEEVGNRPVRGATEHFYDVREDAQDWVDARLAEFS